jgi:hypothetical protein
MEVHHLERNIPYLKTGSKYLKFGDKGVTSMLNMSTMEDFYLFNDPQNWKNGQRQKFYDECTRMLDQNYANDGFFEKYS